ncbi:hypothetical protein BT63DRAFT_11375 [Microthyrium microscopicum]|uniref:BTB domain-containing protein n=1 Tax=Microthyrium microscopicum TaxID=703497 RepID=A0A6A6UU75_9PEZI|nr:hypothetical protein BT63DRAFT_11375 [Microthyrium microscopicum]
MVDTHFARIITSGAFTFVVGKNKRPISFHPLAFSRHSPVMAAMIDDNVSQENYFANIQDIEEDDFFRFCQWAYTGNYTAPKSEPIGTLSNHFVRGGANASVNDKKSQGPKMYACKFPRCTYSSKRESNSKVSFPMSNHISSRHRMIQKTVAVLVILNGYHKTRP